MYVMLYIKFYCIEIVVLKFCGWQQLDLNTDNVSFINGDTVHAAVHRKVTLAARHINVENENN